MKCDSVRLVVEDGDALTLRSLRYSEIRDLDVIELCGDLGITSISRNDLITRIYFDERFKIEPVPGDVCGLGFNVLNSETGFSALEVVNYLLRYTCSNGAVCPFNASTSRKYHYDSGKGPLKQFLKEQVESADRAKMVIIGSIRASLSSGQKPTKVNRCALDGGIDECCSIAESMIEEIHQIEVQECSLAPFAGGRHKGSFKRRGFCGR